MTFNPLMLPALPPTSAAGLKVAGDSGLKVFKSSELGQSTKGSRGFLDTLNRVSLRQDNNHHQSAGAKMKPEVSPGSAKEPPNSGKTGHASPSSPDEIEQAEAVESAKVSPIFDAWQAFGMLQLRFLGFSMGGNVSSSNETQPETLAGLSPQNLAGYFQAKGQGSLIDWLAGMGRFEQLRADISPATGNRPLVEQLAVESAIDQDSRGIMGASTEFIGFWPWQASSEVAINDPAAASWANADRLIAALLRMQQTATTASSLDPDAAGTAGQNASTFLETIKLNEDLLAKVTIPSLPGESDLLENARLAENTKSAENANTAAAGKDALMALWATADPNSKTLLETSSRQINENPQFLNINADIKAAAEQSVNPNLVAQGVPSKPAGDGFSLINAAAKAENPPLVELSSKTIHAEGDNKDAGFLFAQDQMPGHLKPLEGATSALEAAQRGLTSHTMDQVVQKAVLLLNNDQYEVHLELKPEFLGHIRMQIVTENQQVAIKIVAEFPFVKEMLENNLHQLKAELQAQGLNIDELEVSVAHDSYAGGDAHQAAEAPKAQAAGNSNDFDDEPSEKITQSQFRDRGPMAETAIDYFA
jgi:flagellar hook-length control protein FliK